jgi:sulfur-carrier protein adenylyltransferase/sulfurtransferase
MIQPVHRLNRSRLLHHMVIIGCGGTGSALIGGLPFLHQALLAAGQPGLEVIVVDGDKVSATNCVRQPFSESEIGLYKSVVLINRINLFWKLNWQASTDYVTKDTQGKPDIIISCVDTRSARYHLTKSGLFKECVYWLDLGNNADGGQFVLGQPKNRRNRKTRGRLPTVAELFPEIVTPLLDNSDNLPACSAVEALERQEPFINQTLAYHALAMLARLFRHGEIPYHGGFVNLGAGRMAPIPIHRFGGPASLGSPRSRLGGNLEDAEIVQIEETLQAR